MAAKWGAAHATATADPTIMPLQLPCLLVSSQSRGEDTHKPDAVASAGLEPRTNGATAAALTMWHGACIYCITESL